MNDILSRMSVTLFSCQLGAVRRERSEPRRKVGQLQLDQPLQRLLGSVRHLHRI